MHAERILASPTPITLDEPAAQQLHLQAGVLTMHRVWPRVSRVPLPVSTSQQQHLIFECRDQSGAVVAGQWWADPAKAASEHQRIIAADPLATAAIVPTDDDHVLLQAHGADADLPGLAPSLRDGAELLTHRAGRRALACARAGSSGRYIKCMRPREFGLALRKASWAAEVHDGVFLTPELLHADPVRGVAVWAGLPGRSLAEILCTAEQADFERSVFAVGAALRSLHEGAIPSGLAAHHADSEVAVLDRWLRPLAACFPREAAHAAALRGDIVRMLVTCPGRQMLIHRDFYDQQVLIAPGNKVAFLDFDTLAVGDPALDVGNFLAHLELRSILHGLSQARLQLLSRIFLQGHGSRLGAEIEAYTRAARLRVACVHAFRPLERAAAWQMLNRVAEPVSA